MSTSTPKWSWEAGSVLISGPLGCDTIERVHGFSEGARPEVADLDDERRNDETIYVEIEA